VRPLAQTDGHDPPGLVDELVPSLAAAVDEIVVGFEDAVREPVVAHELPDVLHRIELGRFRWYGENGDVGGNNQSRRQVPSGLIDEDDGVGSWCDHLGEFCEVQVHRLGVAGRQDQGRAIALLWADGAEDVGGGGALVAGRAWAGAALRRPTVILFFWPMRALSLHEGSAVNWSVTFASPILIDGTSARRWVRGYRVSQLRLRHLTCGSGPEHGPAP
jgi:hypothetical protein